MRRIWKRKQGEEGATIVEMALVFSIFFPPLLFGTIEIANLLYAWIEVAEVSHAGAVYAEQSWRTANGWSTTVPYPGTPLIQSIAQASAPDIAASSFTGTGDGVTVKCVCSGSLTTDQGCSTVSSATCGSGTLYVTVNTTVSITPLIPVHLLSALPTKIPMSSSATMELYP